MQDLYALVEKSVTQLGYELVDFEVSNRGKLLRLFIDKPEGVNIDDCVLVSNQLGNVLAVENDFDYDRLEVSSPGLDRAIKKESDFVKFTDSRASVKTRMPIELRIQVQFLKELIVGHGHHVQFLIDRHEHDRQHASSL